ncbi:MAG TPA: hypothetical protein VNA89_00190 [Gemmatimonadaceae bacterium]|nr:hypothetical protein [Gemmatimonadaceae bacterium]
MSDAFARALRGRRGELNGRFDEARRRYPALDADAFAAFLSVAVDPVVSAVAALHADRATDAAAAAYDAAIDIVGRQITGGSARRALVDDVWQRVLPIAAAAVAADPARVIAALTNAAYHIAGTVGARGSAWMTAMEGLAARAAEPTQLLAAGQVAAWRAGLAHYRSTALAVADSLPEALALAAVGAAPGASWRDVRSRLGESRWYDPARSDGTPEAPRIATVAGAFRGFGGPFAEPPLVGTVGDQFRVLSGAEEWLLFADAFGATLHRAPAHLEADAQWAPSIPADVAVQGGCVLWHGQSVGAAAWGDVTSAAMTENTLALTGSLAHGVVIVALA